MLGGRLRLTVPGAAAYLGVSVPRASEEGEEGVQKKEQGERRT